MIHPLNFDVQTHIRNLVGSIGWLADATRPNIAPVHSFLSSYSNKPALGYMKAALYALYYVHSNYDYGIPSTSSITSPIHTYIHFLTPLDVEAYTDAIPPSQTNCAPLTAYSDACWGSQIGSAVRDGTLLPLFKFRSMSSRVVFWQGGPLSWTAIRQDQTALSSGEAEIHATNETSKSVVGMRHLAESVQSSGYDISDTVAPSPLYNDNAACIQWTHNTTSKKIWHMELRENVVREWVHDGILNILHVKGHVNPADIFTKEMPDGAHFRHLRDSFMCRLSDFLHQSLLVVHHSHSKSRPTPHLVVLSAGSSTTFLTQNSYFAVLCSFPLCQTLSAISHLSSAGHHLLRRLHHIVSSSFSCSCFHGCKDGGCCSTTAARMEIPR
jgi:hypothetical protein